MRKTKILYILALSTLLLTGCAGQNNMDAPTPQTGQTQSQTTPDNTNGDTMLSEEEARTIALNHAGLTMDQVTFTKSTLDRDDGRVKYEIEFHSQDWTEYDYDIEPYTGQILGYDKDEDIH